MQKTPPPPAQTEASPQPAAPPEPHVIEVLRDEITAYAEAIGKTPSTVCNRVLNSTYLLDRLDKHETRAEAWLQKLREYVAKHPPSEKNNTPT